MGFFDRVVNLARGSVKSVLKPGDPARAAALDAELARTTSVRAERPARREPSADPTPAPGAAAGADRAPPERDASGEIKRTL